ncbi:MAG TPA: chemotaxis protein CheA [Gemmatimonadaceae bacterium]|nr:chemotaxis protein CheA [Gemmatimonadaceae bacterium]
MDLSRYAELFLTESHEHLSALNHSLLELERAPDSRQPVDAIFRAVHTVKGMSATMGYGAVTELAHALETLMDRVRRGEQHVSAAVMDGLFRGADALEGAIERSVEGHEDEIDVAAVVAQLEAVTEAPSSGAHQDGDAQDGGCQIRIRLLAGSAMRGARALLVVKKAETLGRVLHVAPSMDDLMAEAFEREFSIRLDTAASLERIEEALLSVGDVEAVEVADGGGVVPQPVPVAQPAASDAEVPSERRAAAPRHVRIDSRRLDALMNMVGELVITRGRIEQLVTGGGDRVLEEAVAQASRLIGELQEEILLSRMVPVGQVFDRFPRLVRDAARALGKQIEFTIEGKDIELDRSILDEIGEPVVHLLRNAVDHGIEPPAVRVASGKPPWGQLTLSVRRERSSVTIRVMDDGRGIDRAQVLRRSREQGLVDDSATELSDDELVQLISRPGFTTADQVTDLSGRGVGVDAVVTRVRALGGAVEIRSTPGQGTTVTARMPVTLAIVRALLARVDAETYAVPITHVRETVELSASTLKHVKGREVMLVRDDVLPLLRLREMVRLPPADDRLLPVVVLEVGDRRAGLVVDALAGQQDIVVKQFDAVRGAVPLFSGATILADGAPALIMDVGSVL